MVSTEKKTEPRSTGLGFLYIRNMRKRYGLSKAQRLKSRKSIDALFEKGKGFSVFPIRVVYAVVEGEVGVKVGVSASKRNFKKAVHRNRIKRLLREAYRLQQEEFVTTVTASGKSLALFFNYTDKILPTFDTIAAAMAKCLVRLQQKLNEEPS